MIAFLIELQNRAGTLAEVTEAIAQRGINVTGGAGIGSGSIGHFVATTNDEAGTRRVLLGGGYRFREIEVVPLTIADAPGNLARACRVLADAGINVDAVFVTATGPGTTTLAFVTDDPVKARSILG